MDPSQVSPKVPNSGGFFQKDLSNKKTTKSLLQKIALLIPPFFVFVARRFYPIGLKLSCALALIGSSLIYLFQKVFSGKNRKQIDTSKTQKTLEQSNIGVDSKQQERETKLVPRKQKLTKKDLIQAYVKKMNRPEENEQNLKGKAFEIWLLKKYGEILKQFSVGTEEDLASMQAAVSSLEKSEKDVGDERFELITKLEKKIDPSRILEENFKELEPLIKCAEILVVILKHEKDDLIDVKQLSRNIEESRFFDINMEIRMLARFLSNLKEFRKEGQTEENIDIFLQKVFAIGFSQSASAEKL